MPNMPMRTSILLLLCSATLMACFPPPPDPGGSPPGGSPDASATNPCDLLRAPGSTTPGFPYNVDTFNQMILPPLRTGCLVGPGCHGPGNSYNFTVYPSTGSDSTCPDAQTFNEVFADSDYMQVGAMSKIVQKTNGTLGHNFPAQAPESMQMTMLFESYIDAANEAFLAGEGGSDGGGGGGGGAAAFNAATYASQIQPVLDNLGCINSGCHDIKGTVLGGDFGLTKLARANTPELTANIEAIVMRIDTTLDPSNAKQARFYVKSTDRHSGASITDVTALGNLENWIAEGLMNQ